MHLGEQSQGPEGVVVLGMHRSGTSAATRVLNLIGLQLCTTDDLLGPMRGNPTGLWESKSLVELNDRLLDRLGRAWWCPPKSFGPEEMNQLEHERPAAAAALQRLYPHSPWVWKDPRLAMTLPFWRQVIRRQPVGVLMLRNPLDVAASLKRRDDFSMTLGVALWERYNRLLVEASRGLALFVTTFDDLAEDPLAWVSEIGDFLAGQGLSTERADLQAVTSFVQPDLRHLRHDPDEVLSRSPGVGAVFEALTSLRGGHECFQPPELPGEEAWVEAQFAVIGSYQVRPLPEPQPVTQSVIVRTDDADPGSFGASLAARLPRYCELVVLAESSAATERTSAERVVITPVPAGMRLGAARNLALEAAHADLVVFLGPHAVVPVSWYGEALEAFAAGYDAVSPSCITSDGGIGAGLTIVDPPLSLRWLAPGAHSPTPVPVLADTCFAVRRSAVVAAGGFDPAMQTTMGSTLELSLRLWRHGKGCAVTTGARASVDGQSAPAPAERMTADLLRTAVLHCVATEVDQAVSGLKRRNGFPQAAAALLSDGAPSRRLELESLDGPESTGVLGSLHVRLSSVAEDVTTAADGGRLPWSVSVVVISRDEGEALRETVAALRGELDPHDQLIVVDDGSIDGSTNDLGSDVEVIRATERLGVARSRALGADRATGDVLVFSDAHVLPEPGWRNALVAAAVHPAVGAAGPALTPFGQPDVVAGGLTYQPGGLGVRWEMAPVGVQSVPALCGCFLAIRRSVYQQIGGFDTAMGHYGSEDLELCLRLWRAGYRCVTVAQATVAHRFHYGPRPDFDGTDHLYGALRQWSTHLDGPDLAAYVDVARTFESFPAAAALLLTSDVGARRQAVRERSTASAHVVLERVCPGVLGRPGGRLTSPAAPAAPTGHTLVFLGGLHRSGTTLVASLIAAHDDASGFSRTGVPQDEGQHLQDLYPTARAFGGPGRFALAPDAHMTEESPLVNPANAARLFSQWAGHWDLTRRVLVEKSPPNLIRSRFLQALFEEARFVMVLRHPVAVALSTQRWTSELSLEDLLEHWCAAWETFEEDRPHLARVSFVRYEDLVHEPRATLDALGQACDLGPLPPGATLDPTVADATEKQWAALLEERDSGWLGRLEERFGDRISPYGYDLSQPGHGLPWMRSPS